MKKPTHFNHLAKQVAVHLCQAAIVGITIQACPSFGQTIQVPAPRATSAEILARWANATPAEIQTAAVSGQAEAQFVFGMSQLSQVRALGAEASQWLFAAVSNGTNLTSDEKTNCVATWKDAPESKLRGAAKQGDRSAQWFLGQQIQKQAETQAMTAVAWLQKAAAQSCVQAEFELGGIYYKGGPAGCDATKAREWFQRAAEHGHEGAQHQLARALLEDGEDIVRAVELLRQASDQGCVIAKYDLARQYAGGNGDPRHNNDTPFALLAYAATNGLPEAKLGVAERFRVGLGKPRDLLKAIAWYRQAYNSAKTFVRNDESQHFTILSSIDENDRVQEAVANLLAVVKEDGSLDDDRQILDVDLTAILQIEARAARRNEAASQMRMAALYEDGVLTKRDYVRAFYWYSIAARQNTPGAASRRDEIKPRLSTDDLGTVEGWTKELGEYQGRSN